LPFHEFSHIRDHDIVVENVAVRRSTVVPQIYGEDLIMSAETPAHRAPVVSGAEKTVQNNNGAAFSYNFEV